MIRGLLLITLASRSLAHSFYDEIENKWIARMAEAEKEGRLIEEKLSSLPDDKYYESIWQSNLAPFERGISRAMLDSAARLGIRYLIYNHTVYRQPKCVFQARCEGIDYFLKRVAAELPDVEFIVNDFDHPKVHASAEPLPVFSFSKKDADYADILYPAWAFHKGGPAISTYPTGIGRWEETSKQLLQYASSFPWEEKQPLAFFLGSRTSAARDALVLLSRRRPELVDAKYTKNQAYKGPKDTLGAEPAKERPLEHSCEYKYVFNFRGVAASFRFKHLLLCSSLVLHMEDGWREFFSPRLIPFFHFFPVEDNSEEGIERLLLFAREHDEDMKRIAENGNRWVQSHLRISDVLSYWRGLLTSYARLQKFRVSPPGDSLVAV